MTRDMRSRNNAEAVLLNDFDEYRCFYFFHVRVGSLLFGIWQSLSQVAALILVLALIANPTLFPDAKHRLRIESAINFITLGQNDAFLMDQVAASRQQKLNHLSASMLQGPVSKETAAINDEVGEREDLPDYDANPNDVVKIHPSNRSSQFDLNKSRMTLTNSSLTSTVDTNDNGDYNDAFGDENDSPSIPSDSADPPMSESNDRHSFWQRSSGEKLHANIFEKLLSLASSMSAPHSPPEKARIAKRSLNASEVVSYWRNYRKSSSTKSDGTGERNSHIVTNGRRHSRLSDRLVSFLVLIFSMGFTLLLVVGVIRGRPSYLMPYFCLLVFDFVISCITVIGYFSYLPDMKHWIRNAEALPYRSDLLRLNEVALTLLLMTLGVAILCLKFYLLSMVWACYRFLIRRLNGFEVDSGFCFYRPESMSAILRYLLIVRFRRNFMGTNDVLRPPQVIPVPIRCCGLLAADHHHRLVFRRGLTSSGDPDSTQSLLLTGDESGLEQFQPVGAEDEMEFAQLHARDGTPPSYGDVLMKPANSNMPPPYFK